MSLGYCDTVTFSGLLPLPQVGKVGTEVQGDTEKNSLAYQPHPKNKVTKWGNLKCLVIWRVTITLFTQYITQSNTVSFKMLTVVYRTRRQSVEIRRPGQ